MNFKIRFLSLKLVLLLAAIVRAEPPEPSIILPGVVASEITDGDTLTVDLKLRIRVRMSDIDTPEKDQPRLWRRATDDLRRKALGKKCVVQLDMPDTQNMILGRSWTFERWVGKVWLEGEKSTLGEYQRRQGNAKKPRSEYEPVR
jgi:endonuclease YncB( thermonuclease family)